MTAAPSGLPPIPMYLAYSGSESTYVSQYSKMSPSDQALVNHLTAQAQTLTSPAALLKDYKSLTVVLGAFNMSTQIGNTAVLKALMTQDPSDTSSLAYRSGNPAWQRFAKFMSNWSPPPFSNSGAATTIANQYMTNQFEANSGQNIPGMQQALYFTRTIGSVTSIAGLMSDPTLLDVVLNGLGIPADAFGALDYSQQLNILKPRVDLSKFSDPSYVKRTAEQYLIAQQWSPDSLTASQSGTAASGGSAASLLDAIFPGASSSSSGTSSILSLFV